jgi:hypothetical protein
MIASVKNWVLLGFAFCLLIVAGGLVVNLRQAHRREKQFTDVTRLSAAYMSLMGTNPRPTFGELYGVVTRAGLALNFPDFTNYWIAPSASITNANSVIIQRVEAVGAREKIIEARADGSVRLLWQVNRK